MAAHRHPADLDGRVILHCVQRSQHATDLPGLRVILRIGGSRLLRFGVAIFFVGAWLQTIFIIRPDLVRPTDIGTDTSNYYAAGQRLADGHALYALSPGDRPVPQDNPPFFSVPLLSPPPIAVIWRFLAILPDSVVMYAWWVVAVLASTALAAFLIWRARALPLAVAAPLFFGLAITIWSGNVNALLLPMTALVWPATAGGLPAARWTPLAGLIVALAAGVKLTPVLLLWWLASGGQWRAARWAVLFGALFFAGSLVVAGPDSFAAYLDVIRATSVAGANGLSATKLLEQVGVVHSLAVLAPMGVAILVGALCIVFRRRPAVGFAVTALGIVFASPVVRLESVSQAIAALAPWVDWRLPWRTNNAPGGSAGST